MSHLDSRNSRLEQRICIFESYENEIGKKLKKTGGMKKRKIQQLNQVY